MRVAARRPGSAGAIMIMTMMVEAITVAAVTALAIMAVAAVAVVARQQLRLPLLLLEEMLVLRDNDRCILRCPINARESPTMTLFGGSFCCPGFRGGALFR